MTKFFEKFCNKIFSQKVFAQAQPLRRFITPTTPLSGFDQTILKSLRSSLFEKVFDLTFSEKVIFKKIFISNDKEKKELANKIIGYLDDNLLADDICLMKIESVKTLQAYEFAEPSLLEYFDIDYLIEIGEIDRSEISGSNIWE